MTRAKGPDLLTGGMSKNPNRVAAAKRAAVSEDFFGQKIRKCVLCGHRGLCEYSSFDNGPICFDGIACVGRQLRERKT